MYNWKEIRSDIYDALSDYDVNVRYYRPSGNTCGYFTIYMNEEWDWDDIEDDINDVCENWNLQIDDDSDGDFSLNAYWDN